MQQENPIHMFDHLGALLLLDWPTGMEFGIDNISWEVGSKFKGVKMIPLGTHIITYSLASENHMFKSSKFINFTPKYRIHVYRWYPQIEQFLEVKGAEGEGYCQGVSHYHFDAHLGPYPQQNLQFWKQNTRYITQAVLDKLDPIPPKIPTAAEEQSMPIDEVEDEGEQPIPQNAEEMREEQQKNAHEEKQEDKGQDVYYSTVPRCLSSSPQQITLTSMDKTPILLKVISKQWKNKPECLLGELQYSFVHFILGEEHQSLEQWKHLLDLFISSEGAYLCIQLKSEVNLTQLVSDFIPVLYDQLGQLPEDFFRDQLSKGNFLCGLLRRLHQYSRSPEYASRVAKRIQKLMKLLENRFGYYIDNEEDDQDKPVVVDEAQNYF